MITPAPIQSAALFLTQNCNLRCAYCYTGEKKNLPMTLETAQQAIDFLHEHSEKQCNITFLGGEPLLEFKLLCNIARYSRDKYGRYFNFRLSTNGTLLTKKVLSFFREHRIYFALSIDGNRKQHDSQRKFANNRGSYDTIMDNLDDIFEFNPYTMAVSVITPETVNHVSAGAKSLFAEGFRYVLQTLDYSADWKKEHLKTLKEQYTILAEYYYHKLMDGKKIHYGPFDERIRTWAQKPYQKGDLCDIANTHIAVAPSGRLYPCVQFIGEDRAKWKDNSIGDVFSGFDNDRRISYIEDNYREKQSCKGCALDGRCANFCGCVNWQATGNVDQVPPIICEHERMLMPIADRLANRLWKRNSSLFKRKFYQKIFPFSSYIEDCLLADGGSNAAD
ncbi:MAG: radical SAM protein [Candidatus Electryonea clarkiae]|nr:radical SAM protein [Candidatus Electryonea clarkiae]MDP8285525.1 radical SAM protein [Candidatus Electryonea clarkiae]